MVTERKITILNAPTPSVPAQDVLRHFEGLRPNLILPYQRGGAIALEKDLKQALPFVIQAVSWAELGLMAAGPVFCEDMPDGIQTAYSIHIDHFRDYLSAHLDHVFPSFGEPWSILLSRLFMAYANGEDAFLLGDTQGDAIQRIAYEYSCQLSSWINEERCAKNYEMLKPRLTDNRRTHKLLKEYADDIGKIMTLLFNATTDQIYKSTKLGADTIWNYHLDRALLSLKYSFGEYAAYKQRELEYDRVRACVAQILIWRLAEAADATISMIEMLTTRLGVPCPRENPWFSLFELSDRGKQYGRSQDLEPRWRPRDQ